MLWHPVVCHCWTNHGPPSLPRAAIARQLSPPTKATFVVCVYYANLGKGEGLWRKATEGRYVLQARLLFSRFSDFRFRSSQSGAAGWFLSCFWLLNMYFNFFQPGLKDQISLWYHDIWNDLPEGIRLAESVTSFKSLLKTHFLENIF